MKKCSILFLLLLSGCQFYSKIEQPKASVNTEYFTYDREGHYSIEEMFSRLNDPILSQLLKEGVEENLDLKMALERIQEARGQYGVKKSQLWPQIEFEAEVSRLKYSSQGIETVSLFGGTDAASSSSVTNLYFSVFDASWEIDLFQKLLSEKNAAFHEITALENYARDVYLSLQAEIAFAYFEYRSFEAQLKVLYENQNSRQDTLNLIQERFEAGLATGVEVDRSAGDLYDLEAQIPSVESEREKSLNRLCTLLGKQPGSLNVLLEKAYPMPLDPGLFHIEIISDLLRRRPDVREAEEEYIRSQYLTRSSQADLFPRFSLTGSFGFSSFQASEFFDHKNMLWSIGPAVRWPLFKGWEILSKIDQQKAVQKRASLNYYQTVLRALEEVENALIVYHNEKLRDDALIDAVSALDQAHASTWELYTAGLSDFNAVLDVQRRYLLSERERIASYESTLKALVLIYKALGGSF